MEYNIIAEIKEIDVKKESAENIELYHTLLDAIFELGNPGQIYYAKRFLSDFSNQIIIDRRR